MAYTDIDKPSDYIRIQTWSGNNSADREITWTETDNMQPDWIWVKRRSDTANHRLADSVRGATKILRSDTNGAETTESDDTLSFDTNGFSVGSNSGVNKTGDTYVGWGWLAGGTGVSNTNGSITSTVSANTTSGFSIVSYTGNGSAGATIGHSLGFVPKMIIVKSRSDTGVWAVYNENIGNSNGLFLNANYNALSEPAFWNSTSPTSSVFSVGTSNDTNGSGRTYIAYCFAEKKGFSKAFSYTGNGSSDGSFCYLGFRPAFIMIKGTSIYSDWGIWDNKRPEYNVVNLTLQPHKDNAEVVSVGRDIDILSNGFKGRGTSSSMNSSGATYVGIAFAESPFVTSTGIPTTAR